MNDKNGKNNNQKEIKCFNCGKTGHIKKHCRQLKKNNDNKNNKNKQQNRKALNAIDKKFMLMSLNTKVETKQNDWIFNSGASNHITNSLDRFKEMQAVHQKVMVGNGEKIAIVQNRT